MKIVYYCINCQGWNKHHVDDELFIPRQVEFNSFSEATIHVIRNEFHYVESRIEKE